MVSRTATSTITVVDQYCDAYRDLFPEVRTFENFKYLHVGMLSDIKRKSLPEIAKVVGLHDAQPLQNFVTDSPWSVVSLREKRLELTQKMLEGRSFKLVIDETGDKKKGNHTDYVARQYIGNLGKVDNGIVSVNAYGVLGDLTFPLIFLIYKPRKRIEEGCPYKTKPQLAVEIIETLLKLGFNFDLVLADSLYGESPTFISVLEKYKKHYLLAIRSNHREFTLPEQQVIYEPWQEFERVFSDGKTEKRYIQQITISNSSSITYWRVTTDPDSLPRNQTWYVKTDLKSDMGDQLGNLYGFRNWVEYAFKQGKNELGWADFRLTNYQQIEKWWELVMSAYFLVSLQAQARNESEISNQKLSPQSSIEPDKFSKHQWWDLKLGWKSTLNNLRLIIQPYIFWNLIKPWLLIFFNTNLQLGFQTIINIMNKFQGYIPVDSG
ncbi:transposase [Tolypothrix sp. NIES-4075]|uniref:IS701 family transposase n=1 Tax=Tolypothrix sp. NIES-4075 TaxID=2005459 RepID=UPI000B5C7D0C|nr:IS701 family transposase [Tolypothrix sp. NIES-4075]GAX46251.1 transposase [Tolypothrix sp. NIES-4075]